MRFERRTSFRRLSPFIGLLLAWLPWMTALSSDHRYFTEYVEPLLKQYCYECHSHAAGEASGGLVLDSKAGWAKGGSSGPAIIPGDVSASLLWRAVNHLEPGLEMPPQGKLSEAHLLQFKKWIESGADDPREGGQLVETKSIDIEAGRQWWSFKPIRGDAIPPESVAVGLRQIDDFIDDGLKQAKLQPAPLADRATILRRVTYDLTGLPPSSHETCKSSELTDEEYQRYVDTLLGSRAFAEKWARHWLDIARYADSNGSSFNAPFHEAWRYRNWVIDAIDQNLPVDQFIRMQIAGDLLPYDDWQQRDQNLIATGFLMLGSKVLGEFDKEQLYLDVVDEQLDTIGKSLLGMTLACARCHDHKFDPIPQRDYYALGGILRSTITLDDRLGGPKEDESDWHRRGLGQGGDEKLEQFLRDRRYDWIKATQKRFQAYKKVKELEQPGNANTPTDEAALAEARKEWMAWEERLGELMDQLPPHAMAVRDAADPSDLAIRIRGVAASLGDVVDRGFLQVATLGEAPVIDKTRSGRLELAHWLTSDENPLTPRVFVNRVWKQLLREGLVRSVDNFGTTGEQPSHPELLDELALRFLRGGWDLKSLVREIVLSKVYRRSVQPPPPTDPENRWLAGQNRRRLDAEEIRDSLLALSGRLLAGANQDSLRMLPVGDVSNLGDFLRIQDDRRTIYQPVIRTLEPEILQLFDAANNAMVTGARPRTIVAPQALYFLNNNFVHEVAQAIGEKIIVKHLPADRSSLPQASIEAKATSLVDEAFIMIVNREPKPDEREHLIRYLRTQADGEPGLTQHDMLKLCQVILGSTQFQFLD